jgi:hypothetical protein
MRTFCTFLCKDKLLLPQYRPKPDRKEESGFDKNQILCNAQMIIMRRTMWSGGRMAQVEPLNTPTASELTKAHDFLYEADLLVTDVKSLFHNSGDFAMAARLKDIQGRLSDELRALERLIAASKPAFRH